jgi:starch phosphorylase
MITYMALASAVRDRLWQNWVDTAETYTAEGARTAAYPLAEYLLGPHLDNNLINLGYSQGGRVRFVGILAWISMP